MRPTQPRILAWVQGTKRSEIVDKVRLIEIAAVSRRRAPGHSDRHLDTLDRHLKPEKAAKEFGRQSDFLIEEFDEASWAQGEIPGDALECVNLGNFVKPAERVVDCLVTRFANHTHGLLV